MLELIDNNGIAHCRCGECGRAFDFDTGNRGASEVMMPFIKSAINSLICTRCEAERAERERAEAEKEHRRLLRETLDERMQETGFPPLFQRLEAPTVRPTAVWLWERREGNVLLAGPTGSGKTSGAAFVARLLLKDRFLRVRYCTRQTLTTEYVRAKTGADDRREEAFFDRLKALDILVIDELVGKRGGGRLSDSSQEMFFALIDGVYSRRMKTAIWFLGNFYAGAIADLFDDPEPVLRRLNECFAIGWASDGAVNDMGVIGARKDSQ